MKKSILSTVFILANFFLIGQQIRFERIPGPFPTPFQIADFRGVNVSSYGYSDIDDDGDIDIMINGRDNSTEISYLYINDGIGNFLLDTINGPYFFEGTSFGEMKFSDFDGDNDQDIVIIGFDNLNRPQSNLYINNGLGVFSKDSNFSI